MVIWAGKLFPGLTDWYLARTNYEAQQTDLPIPADRPHYLWEPVDEDKDSGAHGIFDGEAREDSLQLRLATHRWSLLAGLSASAAALTAMVGRRR